MWGCLSTVQLNGHGMPASQKSSAKIAIYSHAFTTNSWECKKNPTKWGYSVPNATRHSATHEWCTTTSSAFCKNCLTATLQKEA